MNPIELILNPRTGYLRAGWRAAIFFALLISPYLIYGLLSNPAETPGSAVTVIDVSLETILNYAAYVIWVMAVSWICLRFLERMKISSLGFAFRGGWFGDVLKGCAIGALMITSVVAVQIAGGGSRLIFNPILHGDQGGVNLAGVRTVVAQMAGALVLLIVAAAFEELIFRGYAFQTILRGAPAIIPILLFSIYFGWAHWQNPNRTLFSTANTALAGI